MNAKGKIAEGSQTSNFRTTVEVLDNGPLMVYGPLSVKHSDGKEEQKERNTAFCRCGKSDNKPFCDGSHRK